MARVPVIKSFCPLQLNSMPRPGFDFCGPCQRRVHNLDAMNDTERQTFFASCSDEVCVAYTVKRPARLASLIGVGLATAALSTSGAIIAVPDSAPENVTSSTSDPTDLVIIGGTNARSVKWVDESEAVLPERPVIAEIGAGDWLPTPDNTKDKTP